jgi:hypothetical protein
MRKAIGIALCLIAPAWAGLSLLRGQLLRTGVLNKKDLPPFVGHEQGTLSDYLLNVWHWDALLLLLMIAALPCLVIGILILRKTRGRDRT